MSRYLGLSSIFAAVPVSASPSWNMPSLHNAVLKKKCASNPRTVEVRRRGVLRPPHTSQASVPAGGTEHRDSARRLASIRELARVPGEQKPVSRLAPVDHQIRFRRSPSLPLDRAPRGECLSQIRRGDESEGSFLHRTSIDPNEGRSPLKISQPGAVRKFP